jgi:hypothetical protein
MSLQEQAAFPKNRSMRPIAQHSRLGVFMIRQYDITDSGHQRRVAARRIVTTG